LAETGTEFDVHVKVDTGMHRVGVAPRLLHDLMTAIASKPSLRVTALWTHFPVADEDPDYTRRQVERFAAAVERYEVPMIHMANTAGAALFPEARRTLCRIGLGTYGLHPCPETAAHIDLRPAMRLVTHVSHVQRLRAGERPSYGRVKAIDVGSNLITVPVGYADGFPRALTQNGSALVGGKRYSLAGTVTMDQIVIDVGDDDYDVGDEVVLLGAQGEEEITADEWAGELGTISYEVVCSIGPRIPRRYL
jgi:alanine racemase